MCGCAGSVAVVHVHAAHGVAHRREARTQAAQARAVVRRRARRRAPRHHTQLRLLPLLLRLLLRQLRRMRHLLLCRKLCRMILKLVPPPVGRVLPGKLPGVLTASPVVIVRRVEAGRRLCALDLRHCCAMLSLRHRLRHAWPTHRADHAAAVGRLVAEGLHRIVWRLFWAVWAKPWLREARRRRREGPLHAHA